MLPQSRCQFCGVELTEARWRLTGVCGSGKCQLEWAGRLQAVQRAEMEREAQRRRERAAAYCQEESARVGLEHFDTVLPVAVPANLRPIVALPEQRKRAFRDYLADLAGQAAAERASVEGPSTMSLLPDPPEQSSSTLDELLQRGCATCRGRCCNGGGEHAYLDVPTIARYMERHPNAGPREVLETYLSYLPHSAYEDSCVYHTETGCALPRELRSEVSAKFFCEDLWGFQRRFAQGPVGEVMFVAIEDLAVVRGEPLPAAVACQGPAGRSPATGVSSLRQNGQDFDGGTDSRKGPSSGEHL